MCNSDVYIRQQEDFEWRLQVDGRTWPVTGSVALANPFLPLGTSVKRERVESQSLTSSPAVKLHDSTHHRLCTKMSKETAHFIVGTELCLGESNNVM